MNRLIKFPSIYTHIFDTRPGVEIEKKAGKTFVIDGFLSHKST